MPMQLVLKLKPLWLLFECISGRKFSNCEH